MTKRKFLRKDDDVLFENRKSEVEKSLEKLKEAGTIKEAAVVFSHEGMQLFAQMFGNTMRQMVDEAVDKAVDRKVKEMMEGFMEGMMISALQSTKPSNAVTIKTPKRVMKYKVKSIDDHRREKGLDKKEELSMGYVGVNNNEVEATMGFIGINDGMIDFTEKESTITQAKKKKRHSKPWTKEEEEEITRQVDQLTATGLSANKALEQVTIEGRTPSAIKYRYTTIISPARKKKAKEEETNPVIN